MPARLLQPLAWILIASHHGILGLVRSGVGDPRAPGCDNLVLHLLLPGGAFLVIACIAWRWRRVGATLSSWRGSPLSSPTRSRP